MRNPTPAVLAAASLLAAGACFAQMPPAAAPVTPAPEPPPAPAQLPQADTGFFRPAPDPSLTRPLPPPAPFPAPVPAWPNAAAAKSTQAAPPAAAPLAEELQAELRAQTAMDMMRWTEEQMDRAERENARARAGALAGPAPISGAFTGLTDERSR